MDFEELKRTIKNEISAAERDLQILRRQVDCKDAFLDGLKKAQHAVDLAAEKAAKKSA